MPAIASMAYRPIVDEQLGVVVQEADDFQVSICDGILHRAMGEFAAKSVVVQEADDVQMPDFGGQHHRLVFAALFRSVLVQPADDLQVPVDRRKVHGHTRAALGAILVQPADDVQVPVPGSKIHRDLGAAIRAVVVQPADDVQVPILGGKVHGGLLVALGAVFVQPGDQSEFIVVPEKRVVKVQCCRRAALEAILVHPTNNVEVAVFASGLKEFGIADLGSPTLTQDLDSSQITGCDNAVRKTSGAVSELESKLRTAEYETGDGIGALQDVFPQLHWQVGVNLGG